MLAACSTRPPEQTAARQATPPSQPAPAPMIPPLTLDGYKKEFARRVAYASPDIFDDPLPEMFKSIVVLDIAVDREGRLTRVAVRRSNGYKALENRAMDSVHRAAPFDAPAFALRGHDGSVNFLETFLFRDDGRFQIRSLVGAQ
ncbi:MAG TPA: TonB family protein [Burkholderiales bacterium]|nr:TonB family protein [Burkholderiales bacterium]